MVMETHFWNYYEKEKDLKSKGLFLWVFLKVWYYNLNIFNFLYMAEVNSKENTNILDEFSVWEKEKAEVEKQQKKEEKNIYTRLKWANIFLWVFNGFLVLCFVLFFIYNSIQYTSSEKEYTFLRPVCKIFNPLYTSGQECYGISFLLSQAEADLDTIQKNQYQSLEKILPDIIEQNDFYVSKRMSFLSEKTYTRLTPTEILDAFDTMKNKFSSIDKKEVQCYNLSFSSSDTLDVTCDIYASDWDKKVVEFQDGVKTYNTSWGSSVTKAAYFVDYFENDTNSSFWVLNRDDSFAEKDITEGPYTKMTTVHLTLQYKALSLQY